MRDTVVEASTEWNRYSDSLSQQILNGQVDAFLHWEIIRETMVVPNAQYIKAELAYLKSCKSWRTRWKPAIVESRIGTPISYLHCASSSANLIHHAYHIAQFEEKTEQRINDMDLVFEFGGGYGSMSRLYFNLGFQGRYAIFDLPLFSALQSYYLRSIGLPVDSHTSMRNDQYGITCIYDRHELLEWLELHVPSSGEKSMFLANWSLSESPARVRNFIGKLVPKFESLFVSYQSAFSGVNNIDYFQRLQKSLGKYAWKSWEIEHLPGNYYLAGKRKENL